MKSQPTTTMNRKNEMTTAKRTVGARPANFIIEDARTQSIRFLNLTKTMTKNRFIFITEIKIKNIKKF